MDTHNILPTSKTISVAIWSFMLFLLLAFGALRHACADTYYLSVSGDDTRSGRSNAEAWRSIKRLNTIDLQPGDSVLFEGGQRFPGSIQLDGNDGNDARSPITITSYGTGRAIIEATEGNGVYAHNTQGIHIRDLIFLGSGMNVNKGNGVEFYADAVGNARFHNISLVNLEVQQFGRVGVRIGGWNGNTGFQDVLLEQLEVHDNLYDGILVYGFFSAEGYPNGNVTVRNCRSYNHPGIPDPNSIRGNGIVISNTDGALVEYCVAHDNGSANIHCGGPGGIWTYECNRIIIQFCESFRNRSGSDCDGLGFDLDGGTRNSILQYNYSHDNHGGGFLLGQMASGRPWINNICRFNISENDARTNAGAITVFKEGTASVMDSVFIYNNTVFVSPSHENPTMGAFKITEWYTGIRNVFVYNNIFVTTGGVPLVDVPRNYSAVVAGNCYWPSGDVFTIGYQGISYATLDEWRQGSGNELIAGNPTGMVADPSLVNAGLGGTLHPARTQSLNAYMLSSNSPALESGLDLPLLFGITIGEMDFWGRSLRTGGLMNIGAFQSGKATSVIAAAPAHGTGMIYPNPCQSSSTVSVLLPSGNAEVIIHDALGRQVYRHHTSGGTLVIEPGCLRPGVHFLFLYVDREGMPILRPFMVL